MTIRTGNFNRLIQLSQAAAMSGGFLLLLCEIRFEHRAVLMDDWRAWIPIIFCVLMVLGIPLATFVGGLSFRLALIVLYVLTVVIGALGGFFHSEGHFVERLLELFAVWTSSLQSGAAIKASHPPLLAPFAFMGLGSIGILFCFTGQQEVREKLIAGEKP